MTPEPTGLRERLLDSQGVTPSLRAAYEQDLDALLHDAPTPANRLPAIILLVILLGVIAGEIRALVVHRGDPTFYIAAVTMLIAAAVGAGWIVRDLGQGKIIKKSAHRMGEMFYGVAAILTVASLMHGLSKPDDPASTFSALYVFVFLFVCSVWAIGNRITAAEMNVKEHLLRLECRLADLAERARN